MRTDIPIPGVVLIPSSLSVNIVVWISSHIAVGLLILWRKWWANPFIWLQVTQAHKKYSISIHRYILNWITLEPQASVSTLYDLHSSHRSLADALPASAKFRFYPDGWAAPRPRSVDLAPLERSTLTRLQEVPKIWILHTARFTWNWLDTLPFLAT